MSEVYPVPNEDQLRNLGPGCFVQVHDRNKCYWVEIDGEEGGLLTGIVHPELADDDCKAQGVETDRVNFSRDQVKFVGCDRYCFC
jgi:hypothetical protein